MTLQVQPYNACTKDSPYSQLFCPFFKDIPKLYALNHTPEGVWEVSGRFFFLLFLEHELVHHISYCKCIDPYFRYTISPYGGGYGFWNPMRGGDRDLWHSCHCVCYVFNEKLLNFPVSTGFYRTSPKIDIAKRPSSQSQALALCT